MKKTLQATRKEKIVNLTAEITAKFPTMTWEDYRNMSYEERVQNSEWYELKSKISGLERDIESGYKKLAKQETIVENWQDKLARAEKEDNKLDKLPQCLKDFYKILVADFDKHDELKAKLVEIAEEKYYKWRDEHPNATRNEINEKQQSMRYGYTVRDYYLYHTAEDWHKENLRSAKNLILNLIKRVEKKVGEITEYNLFLTVGNEYEGAVLNGSVKGTKGTAYIESIIAGGWNIQKKHIRTLVK